MGRGETQVALFCKYLDHSGFVVDTGSTALIFDYFHYDKSAHSHAIPVTQMDDRTVFVLVSHGHHDHYSQEIFEWRKTYPNITYILSDDINTNEDAVRVSPNNRYQVRHITVDTLRSTDIGVAFIVKADGYCIYHAGDLSWWHWEGEAASYLAQMKNDYQREINKLKQVGLIDVAFVPVDPRLGDAYVYALDYLMQTVQVRSVVPMHLWNDFSVGEKLLADQRTILYRDKIVSLSGSGQAFVVSPRP